MLVGMSGRDDTGWKSAASVGDMGLTRLGDSLERFVAHLGGPPISILAQLESRWPDIVGPALSVGTRPVELIDGVLRVSCDDPAWASQIGWMEAQIKIRFKEVFGQDLVQRVQALSGPRR